MRRVDLPIANPCQKMWSEMAGDERRRDCEDCGKPVYNLSAMTRAEAGALLLAERPAGLCVRYAYLPDGRVRFVEGPAEVAPPEGRAVMPPGPGADGPVRDLAGGLPDPAGEGYPMQPREAPPGGPLPGWRSLVADLRSAAGDDPDGSGELAMLGDLLLPDGEDWPGGSGSLG